MAVLWNDHEIQCIDIIIFVNGGDGVGCLEDGRVIFVFGIVFGEEVCVRVMISKCLYVFGEVEEIFLLFFDWVVFIC